MTPKEIQEAIVQAFQRQLAMHGIILPVAALADAAAQAAMVLHGALVECPSCGDAPDDCQCRTCQYCDREAVEDRQCEECLGETTRAAARQAREDRLEAWGDWLRDEGKDRRVM